MLNFNDWKKKKDKKTDYEIVKSRSGLPMFVIEPPDLTPDDEPVKKKKSIPQIVSDKYVITSQSIITNQNQRNRTKYEKSLYKRNTGRNMCRMSFLDEEKNIDKLEKVSKRRMISQSQLIRDFIQDGLRGWDC